MYLPIVDDSILHNLRFLIPRFTRKYSTKAFLFWIFHDFSSPKLTPPKLDQYHVSLFKASQSSDLGCFFVEKLPGT